LREYDPAVYEALIDINGKPMVRYVVEALKGARGIRDIAVVGPKQALEDALSGLEVRVVERGDSILANLRRGVETLDPQGNVLIVTADVPLITGEAIDDFLHRCTEKPAEVWYSIIRKETNEAKFPGMKRTYQRLVDGTFTGGNIALLNPKAIGAYEYLMEKAIAMRKRPWLLGSVLGFKCIVKFLLGRLAVRDVEERFERLVGIRGVGIESSYPEIALDVDKPSDLELVRSLLGGTREQD
ncbi:MAG: NTP transferase domain-containing protein, partial [Firmicutes bacterium]|nr:NTP transferase domain-containing protein [Bacillota bacterium]